MLDFSQFPDVSELHPGLTQPGERDYAAHMLAREKALHHIFGQPEPEGQILSPDDPHLSINWPGGGFYQYPPNDVRKAWHYCTSGLSQPIDADEGPEDEDECYSGLGIELVISTPQQAAWAPEVLLNLVRYQLFQENARVILPGHRLPCNGPLVLDTDTPLCHLIAVTSPEYESEIMLPAGRCDLVHLVGVTEAEIDRAKAYGKGTGGTIILARVLSQMSVGVVSDPGRRCLTIAPTFDTVWNAARRACEGP